MNVRRFKLPITWRRGSETVLCYTYWLMARYSTSQPNLDVERAWHALSERMYYNPSRTRRQPRFFALAEDRLPEDFVAKSINVRRLDDPVHDVDHCVTGVDFCGQAAAASELVTAEALLKAFNSIEQYDYTEFAFVGHGATYRPEACCILLAAITYPEAIVCLSTPTSWRAAEKNGLHEVRA